MHNYKNTEIIKIFSALKWKNCTKRGEIVIETEAYRNQLADIQKFFTDEQGRVKRLLNASDVGRYCMIHPQTAKKRFGITKLGITTIELARKLTKAR
jgi:hypothetical protein